jgi:hypothetical protein
VDGYDRSAESLKLAQDVQRSLIQAAAVEASALGLGAILVAVLHTTMLDITGILGAGAVAAMGLYVLPYRRNKLKQELRANINELRDQLHEVLSEQFEKELAESLLRLRAAIAPYTRLVRVERQKLETRGDDLAANQGELNAIRREVEQVE